MVIVEYLVWSQRPRVLDSRSNASLNSLQNGKLQDPIIDGNQVSDLEELLVIRRGDLIHDKSVFYKRAVQGIPLYYRPRLRDHSKRETRPRDSIAREHFP